jgi:phosphoribosylformylglycinamidine synthase
MGDACRKLGTPVTGGNVSFYNQSEDGPVYPTPTIGMVGVLDSVDDKMTMFFKNEGDVIYILGTQRNDIHCSEYLHHILGVSQSPAPHFDLEEEYLLQETLIKLNKAKLILSAHDLAEGGLFVALVESCMQQNTGFEITTDKDIRKDAYLFGEAQSRVIVSVSATQHQAFEAALGNQPFTKIGTVKTDGHLRIDSSDWGHIRNWKKLYDEAIEQLLGV